MNEGQKHIVSLKVLAEGAVSEVMGWLDQWLNSTFSNAHQIHFLKLFKLNINIPIRIKETLWGQFEMTFVKRQGHMKV